MTPGAGASLGDGGLPLWVAVVAMGAFHGLNPAMGWLFAVARGFQEGRRSAVLRSLVPLALGHEVSLAVVLVPALVGVSFVSEDRLRLASAVALVAFGAYRLRRPSHPRFVGFRISERQLAVWSFLMSSAHGAGLMLLPTVFGLVPHADSFADPADAFSAVTVLGVVALSVHALATVTAMGGVALIVYQRLGVEFLRRAWVNLDRVWAIALVGVGGANLFT